MSKHRLTVLLLLAAMAAGLSAGCGGAAEVSASAAGWTATLSWTPQRLLALRQSQLRLRFTTAAGDSMAVEQITARAVMPEMGHRGDPLAFRCVRPDEYEALHTFSMDGEWEIRISGRAKGTRVVTTFQVVVGRE